MFNDKTIFKYVCKCIFVCACVYILTISRRYAKTPLKSDYFMQKYYSFIKFSN